MVNLWTKRRPLLDEMGKLKGGGTTKTSIITTSHDAWTEVEVDLPTILKLDDDELVEDPEEYCKKLDARAIKREKAYVLVGK